MNKVTIYTIEEYSEEFNKVKNYGHYDYPVDMWLVGSAIDKAMGSTIVYKDIAGIYDSFTAAEEDFNKYYEFSSLDELSSCFGKYIKITDYCIVEYVYDLDSLKEDYDDINTIYDLIKRLNKDPWDYLDYECANYGVVIRTSGRKYTAWVEYEDSINGLSGIERTFIANSSETRYNAYLEAEEWMNNQWDKLVEKEDNDEGIYTVDCGVWY